MKPSRLIRFAPCLLALASCGCISAPTVDAKANIAELSAAPPMPAGPGRQVNITVEDYHFGPDRIVARPGEKLHLVVTNRGENEHNLTFDLPQGPVQLPSNVPPGQTEQFDLVAPKQAATYFFHCPVGNHYSRGMMGTIEVR